MFKKKELMSLTEMAPKLSKQHQELREEVVKSREQLMAAIAKLEKAFNLTQTKKRP